MGTTVVLNAERINYDHQISYDDLDENVLCFEDSKSTEILERVQTADVVVSKELPLGAELIMAFPDRVKLICEAGTGYNNIDLEACQKKGITVCNVPAYSTKRVAHTAILLMLSLASSMRKQLDMLHDGNYDNFTKHLMVDHFEINGKTLGIIGAGHIGKEVKAIAEVLGMNVIFYSRTIRDDGNVYVSLDALLKQSDYVSLHCPLNKDTYHLIDADALQLMKPTAFLINTARGALIDETALIDALEHHVIAGAGLDVQEVEPPCLDNPLYHMEQVILTPHMGWRGLETRKRLVARLKENIDAYYHGEIKNRIV